jgi:PilZ domain
MALPMSADTETRTWVPDPGRRRSLRVLLSVPVFVNGKNASGQDFEEETRTLVVNAHGALISLVAPVPAGQQIRLSNKATHQSLNCRVVYVSKPQAGRSQMGIEFEKPWPSFWQIDFPPDDWIAPDN